MHDGSSFDLFKVRYVPNLIQNLISLEALESTNLVITVVGGALKICLCGLVVMIGTWHNNLYFVQDSRVEGGAEPLLEKLENLLWILPFGIIFMKKALSGLGKHTWFVFCMHYILEKQFGVKYWMIVNQLFGLLDCLGACDCCFFLVVSISLVRSFVLATIGSISLIFDF